MFSRNYNVTPSHLKEIERAKYIFFLLFQLCYHTGQVISGPEERDTSVNTDDIKIISKYIRQYMPGLKDKPAIVETCLYTVS